MSSKIKISLADVQATKERISPYIRHTPIAPLPWFSDGVSSKLQLKLENLQVAGSFKSRGAFNNLLLLNDEERKKGVIAASGGNHGFAMALAAKKLSVPCTIVLPVNATVDRVQRITNLGAKIISNGNNPSDAYAFAIKEAKQQKITFIHGFEGEKTWQGIGTLGLELLEDFPKMDCLLVAIGGGGLISGLATVIKEIRPDVKIIGVEPSGAASMLCSIRAKKLTTLPKLQTISDTLAVHTVSESSFYIAKEYVDAFVTVSDQQTLETMKFLWREYNQLVEPAGAVALAAVKSGIVSLETYQSPVALICGGNASARDTFENYAKAISS